jgi:FlaA1/EpsC-like NDP-sugar epimerase
MIGVAEQSPAPPGPRGLISHVWGVAAHRSVSGRTDAVLLLLDAVLVGTAYLVMLIARYEARVPHDAWRGLGIFLLLAATVHLGANRVAGLYGPVWQQASIHEAQRLLLAGAGATAALTIAMLALPRFVPLSVVLIGGGIATGLFGILRFQSRLFAFHHGAGDGASRVLIVGAGNAAASLLRDLEHNDDVAVRVVGLLDDDPHKHGRLLFGAAILGGIDDLVDVGRRVEIDLVILAIPSATSELVRRVADACTELGVELKVLPSVSEFVNGRASLADVRDLSIDDLLGRQQIRTDLAAVAAMVQGRRVMVTGAGGSIGSEIVRQVAAYQPERLVLVDRDETNLFDASNSIGGTGVEVLLDIRDRERVHHLLARERPHILFHAAANKHVPLLESHACEAVATNVLGTRHLLDAALGHEVERVVFISTDKAVHPCSAMGASKRIGEQLVLTAAPEGAAWCAVRFGNVLGSRGSVVPTFVRQIRQGGPVTLTHPDMTRFFMSIPEAVQLVLQAGALAHDREVFMLDMGEPVRIADLAERMISLAGYRVGVDIRIEVTGLRPGERLTEELSTPEEEPRLTSHPKIMQLRPPLFEGQVLRDSVARLAEAVDARDDALAHELLFEVAHHQAPAGRSLSTAALEGAGR